MSTVQDIYDCIDEAAPFSSALSFDNVGILVGDPAAPVHRAMLALDITPAVIAEAAGKNVDLLISHHPVIFEPMKAVRQGDVPFLLIENHIAALCCHTNLDRSPVCGVNIALGRKLGLQTIRFQEVGEDVILFTGELPREMSPREFALYGKQKLGSDCVKFCAGDTPVKTVAFSSGAGVDGCMVAKALGADAFLTGEMKHHEELQARAQGITTVTAGHYWTECVFAGLLSEYLRKRIKDVGFIPSVSEQPPMTAL